MLDLLSYSIMLNGDRAITYNSHFMSLPDIKHGKVTLPPIASYVSLTETNLNTLNFGAAARSSATPSLTLLLALELPLLSPRATPATPSAEEKKRRQRMGPLCDSCRARKVKCNADVVMLTWHDEKLSAIAEYTLLPAREQQQVAAGELVQVAGDYVMVLLNHKLVKFKPCMLCASKGLACCFSKGFTKEDIVQTRRVSGLEALEEARPRSKKRAGLPCERSSPRKSSCGACRRRKVKCQTTLAGRCVGCVKKGILCSFEN